MDLTLLTGAPALTTLIVLTAKASLLLCLALIARAALRKASASTRSFLLSTALIVVGFLPLLDLITPDRELPLPNIIQTHLQPQRATNAPTARPVSTDRAAITVGAADQLEVQTSTGPITPASVILGVWLSGFFIALARVLAGIYACARKRRTAETLNSEEIRSLVGDLSHKLELRKNITIIVSTECDVPYVEGTLSPTLHLPQQALSWPKARLSSILIHELAHLKRRDHIVLPLLNLVASWQWFNPLVWFALALIRRDREKACDDIVLTTTESGTDYARHLLDVCSSIGTATCLTPASLPFARKNNVKERILHMLNRNIERSPIGRGKKLAFALMLGLVAIPLTSITGFSDPVALININPGEREAIISALDQFYAELSAGTDYRIVRDRFLTSDYFDDPNLTLEYLDRAVWRPVFDNTLLLLKETGVGVAKQVQTRIVSMERDDDEIIVTQQVDITADRVVGATAFEDEDGNTVLHRDPSTKEVALEDCRLVNSLSHQIRFRRENGLWKISRYDDGIAIMRMDTDNPHGPIFLVWMEEIDSLTTPFGAGIFKIIPRDIIPDATNTEFSLLR